MLSGFNPAVAAGSHSQNQSRSSSIKRNNGGGTLLQRVNQGVYNPGSGVKSQMIQGKLAQINSAAAAGKAYTGAGNATNIHNLLGVNNDYRIEHIQE